MPEGLSEEDQAEYQRDLDEYQRNIDEHQRDMDEHQRDMDEFQRERDERRRDMDELRRELDELRRDLRGEVTREMRVTVDAVTRPNALVSGRVVFSDGEGAAWLVDQYGRPGLVADTKGYRPSPQDMQDFQVALEKELVRLGL